MRSLSDVVSFAAVAGALGLSAACTEGSPGIADPCSSPAPGSETDLSVEPNYALRDHMESWQNSDGCRVRLDIVMWRRDTCSDSAAVAVVVGDPIGTPQGDGSALIYGRPASGPADAEAVTPATAINTGYSLIEDGTKLFMAADKSSIYLRFEDGHAERWDPNTGDGCA